MKLVSWKKLLKTLKLLVLTLIALDYSATSFAGRVKYSLEGDAEGSFIINEGYRNTYKKMVSSKNLLSLRPSVKQKVNRNLKYRLSLDYSFAEIQGSNNKKSHLNIPAAFFQYKISDYKIKLGFQTFNFGNIDGSSPIDVVNSKNSINPLNPKSIGSLALSTTWSNEFINTELFFISNKEQSLLPGAQSFWMPQTQLNNVHSEFGTVYLPESFNYTYYDPVSLDNALNGNYGLHTAFQFQSFDLQFLYFNGAKSTPQVRSNFDLIINPDLVSARLNSDIELLPVYYKIETFGFAVIKSFEKLIVKAEAAQTKTKSSLIDSLTFPGLPAISGENGLPSNESKAAISIESNFSAFKKTFTYQIQAYNSQKETANSNLPGSQSDPFSQALGLGFILPINSSSQFQLLHLSDTLTQGLYSRLSYNNKIANNFLYKLNLHHFSGDEQSLLGSYSNISNISLILSMIY
ncbi:MAG: hypothetical protein HOO06_15135 [Bdellovibrionaceae bacterium]|nr:hypothetical protein [Pseudobdellovibrionaceae bacterium]